MSQWSVIYEGFDPAAERARETLCTLGNGYFATRGAVPEAAADGVHYPGTYVAGCYDRLESHVAGRTFENEDLVNVPNWLALTFRVDQGDWFDMAGAELLGNRHELDLERGALTRRLRFVDPAGRTTSVVQRRLVSMADPHVAALETTFVAEDWSGRLCVRAALDGRITNRGVERYRDLSGAHLEPVSSGHDAEEIAWLQMQTASSRIRVAEAMRIRAPGAISRRFDCTASWVGVDLDLDLKAGVPVTVEKAIALHTSLDRAIGESLLAATTRIRHAGDFAQLLDQHVLAWKQIRRSGRTTLTGARAIGEEPQKTLDLYAFHILQTLSTHTTDLDVGVPARGLSGEAYRGHVFWDELFVFPFLTLRLPEVARALLMYRWRRLPQARWAAEAAGYRGAMYPWQSGSDGRDETQQWHLNPRSGRWLPDNSHLQRHVGIAVAHNVWLYYQATGDLAFLSSHGAEMLLDIALFWSTLATFDDSDQRYQIRGVMGPDEYHDGYPASSTPGIDNNAYTNVMVAWLMRRALEALRLIPVHRRDELRERLGLSDADLSRFEDMTRRMRVDFHGRGVISQFEGYDQLAEFDWAGYRAKYGDIRRLDRILESEGSDVRLFQVSKQADVLMLFFLLSKDELTRVMADLGYSLKPDDILRTVEYYLARTSHGSTLSAVVHAWVLSRTDRHASWRFFLDALASDVADTPGGTTAEGIHLGAMAGCVDLVQRCYTGLEIGGDVLRLDPRLPRELAALELTLRYRGHWGVTVRCTQEELIVGLPASAAAPITVALDEKTATLPPGETWQVRLTPARSHRRPQMPPG
ncbi:glycosyl hydrolase family 65 protein [Actinopolymorpha sp. B17G11]|uniref:glycoside hydrolase family 65 protein n=1 Tax=Actinopolymorpha sp. B17G11 TaxID=3160861 RepID=UPI0032E4D577